MHSRILSVNSESVHDLYRVTNVESNTACVFLFVCVCMCVHACMHARHMPHPGTGLGESNVPKECGCVCACMGGFGWITYRAIL